MNATIPGASRKFYVHYVLLSLTHAYRYWNWSLDVSSTDNSSTAVYDSPVFDPVTGFGGNGPYVEATPEENTFNLTGRLGGGCVLDGPFIYPNFTLNRGGAHCLTRDFLPPVMNTFAQQSLVDHVLASKDYTEFARRLENIPSFSEPNIHGSGKYPQTAFLGVLSYRYRTFWSWRSAWNDWQRCGVPWRYVTIPLSNHDARTANLNRSSFLPPSREY